MECDYNADSTVKLGQKQKKLLSHGGAIATAVGVDCFSGFVHGKLLKSVAKAVESLCLHHNPIIKVARSEPYDHSVETGTVEVVIGMIKRLIRLAVTLILRNPNMTVTGFTANNILKLWGEYFHWAIAVINMKPSPHDSTRSRYEVFKKVKPNMQNIRLLPISSIVMAWRSKSLKGTQSNQSANLVGIYVGPSLLTEGCARIAVFVGGYVKILTTSHFSAASNGGGLNVFPHVAQGLQKLLDEQVNGSVASSDTELENPEYEYRSTVSTSGVNDVILNDVMHSVVEPLSVNDVVVNDIMGRVSDLTDSPLLTDLMLEHTS